MSREPTQTALAICSRRRGVGNQQTHATRELPSARGCSEPARGAARALAIGQSRVAPTVAASSSSALTTGPYCEGAQVEITKKGAMALSSWMQGTSAVPVNIIHALLLYGAWAERVGAEDEPSACVAFRRAAGCSPADARDPARDAQCDVVVRSDWAGFCECAHEFTTGDVACGHDEFTCAAACADRWRAMQGQGGAGEGATAAGADAEAAGAERTVGDADSELERLYQRGKQFYVVGNIELALRHYREALRQASAPRARARARAAAAGRARRSSGRAACVPQQPRRRVRARARPCACVVACSRARSLAPSASRAAPAGASVGPGPQGVQSRLQEAEEAAEGNDGG